MTIKTKEIGFNSKFLNRFKMISNNYLLGMLQYLKCQIWAHFKLIQHNSVHHHQSKLASKASHERSHVSEVEVMKVSPIISISGSNHHIKDMHNLKREGSWNFQ
jgi:hypothetical protein